MGLRMTFLVDSLNASFAVFDMHALFNFQEEGIAGFSCAEWLPFMQTLESKYRKDVLKSMKQLS